MVLIVDGASRISSTASAKRKEEGRIRIEDTGGGGGAAHKALVETGKQEAKNNRHHQLTWKQK